MPQLSPHTNPAQPKINKIIYILKRIHVIISTITTKRKVKVYIALKLIKEKNTLVRNKFKSRQVRKRNTNQMGQKESTE